MLLKEETLSALGLGSYKPETTTVKATAYQYFTDDKGNVTQYNPDTGETKNLGPIGKGTETEPAPAKPGEIGEISAGILTNVNELLSADLGMVARITNRDVAGKLNQVIQQLAVNARAMIKGQGQVSDKETEMLKASVTTLQTAGLSQEAIKSELKKISGILRSNSGQNVEVQVLENGKIVDEGILNREDIYDALSQGYQVIYK